MTDTEDAGDQARKASEQAAGAQREALEYMKEREKLPQQFREEGLQQIAGAFGLEGGKGTNLDQLKRSGQLLDAQVDQARGSQLYNTLLGSRESMEDAVLRNASAIGMSRSGNVRADLGGATEQLERNALMAALQQQQAGYGQQLAGIQGMARLPSNANAI